MMIGRWTRLRILVCALVMGGGAFAVANKATQVQVRDAAELRELARDNYLKEIEISPRRGRILDRRGNELASTVEMDSISCNPRVLIHVPDGARKLARVIGEDPREFSKKIQKRAKAPFMLVKRFAPPEMVAAALALGLPGVETRKEYKRAYPAGELAGTVLGHAGDGTGKEGLEKAYERVLHGSRLQVTSMRDGVGRQLMVSGGIDPSASAGHDLVLTLDRFISYVTRTALLKAVETHKAKAGTVVVMDARNGHILAMENVPSLDPGAPAEGLLRQARNRAVTDMFEPGSTMKTLTFAAVLDAGKVRATDTLDCEMGRLKVGNHIIKDDHPKGILTAAEAFKHSSNICTIKIARRIGKDALWEAFARFGFGKRTGVGVLSESPGLLWRANRWGEIGFATNAFGQGVSVTPLQMTAAYTAVASGGVYRTPRLTLEVVRPDGHREELKPAGHREERVISEKAARTLLDIMVGVTEKGGTAERAAIPGYRVAGKTGTAQKVGEIKPGKFGYSNKRIGSFIGIVPADDPRLVISVIIDEPGVPLAYGGLVAAPAFKEIAESVLVYLGVSPSVVVAKEDKGSKKTPVAAPQRAPEVAAEGGWLGDVAPPLSPDVNDEVVVADEGGEDLAAVDPDYAAGQGDFAPAEARSTVPDFRGMSLGQAIRAARRAGVELAPVGSGVAFSQSLAAGAHKPGAVCRVAFRPGG